MVMDRTKFNFYVENGLDERVASALADTDHPQHPVSSTPAGVGHYADNGNFSTLSEAIGAATSIVITGAMIVVDDSAYQPAVNNAWVLPANGHYAFSTGTYAVFGSGHATYGTPTVDSFMVRAVFTGDGILTPLSTTTTDTLNNPLLGSQNFAVPAFGTTSSTLTSSFGIVLVVNGTYDVHFEAYSDDAATLDNIEVRVARLS